MFYFDPRYLLFMLPGLLFSLWAQNKVRGAYSQFSKVRSQSGLTGAQAAREVLNSAGLYDVPIEPIPGELSDHYDPRKRVLRLSQGVYGVPSVAAVGIAAHEAGHAIQHAQGYAPLQLRTAIVPAVSIGSNVGFILLIIGFIFNVLALAWVGVGLFALATVFALITLPVEFNASDRARTALVSVGIINDGTQQGIAEAKGVKDVLSAAAWTYIAGFAVSVLNLLYYVMLLTGARRSD
jgi:Zn-dependent membrane protease YugP